MHFRFSSWNFSAAFKKCSCFFAGTSDSPGGAPSAAGILPDLALLMGMVLSGALSSGVSKSRQSSFFNIYDHISFSSYSY